MQKVSPIIVLSMTLASCGSTPSPSAATPSDDGGSEINSVSVTEETVTLTMGPFTIPPSTEVFKCQDFANPFGGGDQDILAYESHMTPGSHHMFLFFNKGNENGAVQDCAGGGLEFHPYPYSTQMRDATMSYPDGVGSLIPAGTGFRLNAHYVNPGATPLTGKVTAVLRKAPPGTVKQHAGVIFMNDLPLVVPPGESTSKATCSVPGKINIIASGSHMHQRATAFTAKTADGTLLYETTEWADPPMRVFEPPLPIPQKTDVTWGCTYKNETGSPLTFGEFAQTNVMCILTMHYYPVADPKKPTINCQNL